jgi:hypothetical protein
LIVSLFVQVSTVLPEQEKPPPNALGAVSDDGNVIVSVNGPLVGVSPELVIWTLYSSVPPGTTVEFVSESIRQTGSAAAAAVLTITNIAIRTVPIKALQAKLLIPVNIEDRTI